MLVAATFLGFAAGWPRWLRVWPFLWLGGVSCPLYRQHETIGFVLPARMRAAGVATDPSILIALLVPLGVAWAVSGLVDRPALRALRAVWRRLRPS